MTIPLEEQSDLPPGRTHRCEHCDTRLREGQPHAALKPYPHGTLEMLIKEERL